MESKSDTAIFIDESTSSSVISICRICHEQEFESLEAPCACSGTVRFAHRDCIQRWCNEKGNTTCEICLQKFKPGYTAPPKLSQLVHTTAIIRESLVVPTNEVETENSGENLQIDYISADNDTASSCCRSVALILTSLLLIRHLFDVLAGGAKDYPFPLITVLIVKATGIIVPMYMLIRIIALICNNIKHHQYQNLYSNSSRSDNEEGEQIQGLNNA